MHIYYQVNNCAIDWETTINDTNDRTIDRCIFLWTNWKAIALLILRSVCNRTGMAFPISGMEMFSKNVYGGNYQAFEAMYKMKKKTDNDSAERKPESGDNLFENMRGYLILGRFIGVIPLSGVFSSSHASLRFK